MRLLPVTILAVGVIAALPCRSADFEITSELDEVDVNPGDGVCEATGGGCTLRAAIQEANALPGTDSLHLPVGLFILTLADTAEDAAADGDLDITDDLDLEGAARGHSVIEGSEETGRIFQVLDGAVVSISRLSLRGAECCAGCGVQIQQGDVSLSDCDVADHREIGCAGGGGILIEAGNLSLSQVSIRDIRASGMAEGGGLRIMGGNVTMDQCDVRRCSARQGGGIELNAGSLEINRSTIALNRSGSNGGGLFAEGGSLEIRATTLRENEARTGGAAAFRDMSASLKNCTVTANTADVGGGLAVLTNAGVAMNNCTVTGNSADTRGHGASTGFESMITLSNSIMAGNGDVECQGPIWSQGYNLFGELGTVCQIVGDTIGNLSGLDPMLLPLGHPDGYRVAHLPDPSSPAVAAGNPAAPGSEPYACEPGDQVGNLRDSSLPCDMGSVESVALDGCDLLRSDVILSLVPLTPPLASIFTGATDGCSVEVPTLHLADPDDCGWGIMGEGYSTPLHGSDDADDWYGFASSMDPNPDPETGLVSDQTRPLMFWQLAPSTWCGPLKMVKDPARDSVIIHAEP